MTSGFGSEGDGFADGRADMDEPTNSGSFPDAAVQPVSVPAAATAPAVRIVRLLTMSRSLRKTAAWNPARGCMRITPAGFDRDTGLYKSPKRATRSPFAQKAVRRCAPDDRRGNR